MTLLFNISKYRLEKQLALLEAYPLECKIGGATGNCAAHLVAYPNIDWEKKLGMFSQRLGLKRQR
jgi:adenylosuccinate lyase